MKMTMVISNILLVKNNFYFLSILLDYVPLESTKEVWKNSHFENMRAGFLSTLISLIAVEVGINVEGGIFWKKLVHKCNKRGVEGGKNLRNQ